MATNKRQVIVTQPVATLSFNKHRRVMIYALEDSNHVFGGQASRTYTGPGFVVATVGPNTQTHHKFHRFSSREFWAMLAPLLKAGLWAISEKRIAGLLPEEIAKISPRFSGTTQGQRQRMQEKLPSVFVKDRPKNKVRRS